jgi:hypothetical protein
MVQSISKSHHPPDLAPRDSAYDELQLRKATTVIMLMIGFRFVTSSDFSSTTGDKKKSLTVTSDDHLVMKIGRFFFHNKTTHGGRCF